jgi:hypothetical protein
LAQEMPTFKYSKSEMRVLSFVDCLAHCQTEP